MGRTITVRMKPILRAGVAAAVAVVLLVIVVTAIPAEDPDMATPMCQDDIFFDGNKRCCTEHTIMDTQRPGGMMCP